MRLSGRPVWLALAAVSLVSGCGAAAAAAPRVRTGTPSPSAIPARAATAAPTAAATAAAASPTAQDTGGDLASLERMAGQLVMAGMIGTQPDADLLQRVQRGEVGGVVIFGANVSPGLAGVLETLQRAAAAGSNPPLLISVDQEGGSIRRLPGPPESPRSMASVEAAAGAGLATGALLARDHINVDLAPVADVSRPGTGFEAAEGRGFAGEPAQVATLADAFAMALQRTGVAATAKHFPGIGSLAVDTDTRLGRVGLAADQLQQDMLPFQRLIDDGTDMVMVANAVYPALDATAPAVFSSAIMNDLLRGRLGFRGVVITDGLDAPPDLGGDPGSRAVRAVAAGADMVLFGPSADGPLASRALVAALQSGALPASRVREAYDRVIALKRQVIQ